MIERTVTVCLVTHDVFTRKKRRLILFEQFDIVDDAEMRTREEAVF
jgi:hypothetical protein